MRQKIFAAYFFLVTGLCALLFLPAFVLPRAIGNVALSFWGWLVSVGLKAIVGVSFELRGREHIPTTGALIAAKHQGAFDTVAPFIYLPAVAFVLKKELLNIPFYGWYARKTGQIPVDREGHAAALKTLVINVRQRIGWGRQVVIFPEGTRTAPGAAPDYKPGVAALYRDLGLPCTPMATNSGLYWPPKGFPSKPGVIVFEFLAPIPAGLKRGAFMQELESRIETASAALVSNQT